MVNGITIIDDYAHHPTEIRATLAAARVRYPKNKIWVVWQPHTFTRTRLLFNDFVRAFDQVDQVLVTDIYAAREQQPEDGFSSRSVAEAITFPETRYMADFSQIVDLLVSELKTGDVLMVLSAGDADQISARVQSALKKRSEQND